jgi:hypothetical protein
VATCLAPLVKQWLCYDNGLKVDGNVAKHSGTGLAT